MERQVVSFSRYKANKKLPALDFLPKSIVSLKNRRRIYLMATRELPNRKEKGNPYLLN